MAFHLKGVKKSTLTDEMRKVLCKYKNEHPSSSKKDLQQWVQQTFDLSVSQSTISNTFKSSFDYLSKEIKNSNVKMHKSAKYPELEKTRHGIKPYRRFGESGLVVMENIKDVLPQTRAKLEIFYWKDIYNMDETGLFYQIGDIEGIHKLK
ncbi:hypothetical protein Goklo_001017 [Gossypium klotzschianum]|uniref:ARS-binding protein 1 N-terminal domain-containing protein n=1 Tax=Gossypium klotzschianum TaxID=34286 RepID=A0A7J8W063_9ROSI|nr:hypothetical protein [Gossypium klotzschianum]